MNYNKADIFKQLGKALCYYALFLGTQAIVSVVMSIAGGIIVGMKYALSGDTLSPEAMATEVTNMVLDNTGWIVLIYTVLTLLFLWIFFLIRKKKLFAETGMVRFPVNLLSYAVIIAIGLTGFVNTALNLLPESWLDSYAESSGTLLDGPFFLMLVATGICAPILEEIIFRGLILSRLRKVMPFWVAAFISSLLFGLAHGHPLWIAYATLLGIAFCVVTKETGSILPSMLIHAIFNSAGTLMSYSEFAFTEITFWATLGVGLILMILGFYLLIKKQKIAD